VNERLPILSGAQLIVVLRMIGWEPVRQRGSHVCLKRSAGGRMLVVPLHRELKRGTLAAILRDADLNHDELRRLL
jgi:predicted RNA binding protein YcfA (HicA-like mRNA interferase family)